MSAFQIIATIVLIGASAFFVAIEFALIAARNYRLEEAAQTSAAARAALRSAKERGADRGVDLLPLGRDADGDGAEDVLVLARGEVQMRSLSDGVIAWTAEAATRCDDERGKHSGKKIAVPKPNNRSKAQRPYAGACKAMGEGVRIQIVG